MKALKFVDSHNMIAYMEKSIENANFDEIVDFLNGSSIIYALTVSPTIYVSYIEQFWSTTKIKTVNNERQIRAKVNGKTIVISESSVRRDLPFNDEDDVGKGSRQPTELQHTPQEEGRNEIGQDEGVSWFQKDAEIQGRYGYDIKVTTASTPITTAGVSVSTAEPSTPPTTTTLIEDEDLTIA
ncbi:hypothetical protein Tco_0618200 [Tanacetum coccineum]